MVFFLFIVCYFEEFRPPSRRNHHKARNPIPSLPSESSTTREISSSQDPILCNYTLCWSISMVHGNRSPLVIPERISVVHSRYA